MAWRRRITCMLELAVAALTSHLEVSPECRRLQPAVAVASLVPVWCRGAMLAVAVVALE